MIKRILDKGSQDDMYVCNLFLFPLPEFTKGMILPQKDNIKENISNITSGFNAKVSVTIPTT
jgi:hypothetical protein